MQVFLVHLFIQILAIIKDVIIYLGVTNLLIHSIWISIDRREGCDLLQFKASFALSSKFHI